MRTYPTHTTHLTSACLADLSRRSGSSAKAEAAERRRRAHVPYFPENASGLNAGLTLIVLNVHSSVVFPSTDRET
jgi:hypothetical protein